MDNCDRYEQDADRYLAAHGRRLIEHAGCVEDGARIIGWCGVRPVGQDLVVTVDVRRLQQAFDVGAIQFSSLGGA